MTNLSSTADKYQFFVSKSSNQIKKSFSLASDISAEGKEKQIKSLNDLIKSIDGQQVHQDLKSKFRWTGGDSYNVYKLNLAYAKGSTKQAQDALYESQNSENVDEAEKKTMKARWLVLEAISFLKTAKEKIISALREIDFTDDEDSRKSCEISRDYLDVLMGRAKSIKDALRT